MANELIINASLPEIRIALMENGEIQELLIERASEKGIVGNIYKGRVTRVLPGMQAAFVDIGLEKAAFLYVDDVYSHEILEEQEGGLESEIEVSDLPESLEEEVAASALPLEQRVLEMESASAVEVDPFDAKNAVPEPVVVPPEEKKVEVLVVASEEKALEGPVVSETGNRRKFRRGKRGGRFRKRTSAGRKKEETSFQADYPENYQSQVADAGSADSDRSELIEQKVALDHPERPASDSRANVGFVPDRRSGVASSQERPEFKSHRGRDRRIRQKASLRSPRSQVNIQDLLKEDQEVLVQVAKDPIAAKGARLTCHISLPGRHLVCMPTIDHVGVSRRIEKDDERRRLREYVERHRPKNLGFIVRTASGKQQSEKRIKQDIEYLTHLWSEIREKASSFKAPALVYEDLNSVLRSVRDWVNEDIDKVVVDSRNHQNEILKFVSHFMPSLKQKIDLYHGDIPIFDAYGISTELSRSLERKVWLKSGGYIVIDQAEALVAIDVNTGRYVGKKNLEDTILKTNLEAVEEIAYQLRLRNCGGIIILDLIDMEKDENKHRVYRALEDALARDRARPSILKISELGLVEMTRKRTRDTIIRTLCESCSFCEGKGFIKSKQTVAYELMREMEREGIERDVSKILVQAHPEVIDILAIDERDTLDQMERKYRKQIYLQAVGDFHPEQFEVTADKREKSHKPREVHRSSQKAPAPVIIVPVAEPIKPAVQAAGSDDFFDEEDRLAFLRAQAAQDAALARLGNHAPRHESAKNEHRAPLGGGATRDRGRRGGHRFRRNQRGNHKNTHVKRDEKSASSETRESGPSHDRVALPRDEGGGSHSQDSG